MKMCAKCGGSMKKGGATKKMAKGGVQKIVGMPGYNATLYPTSFKSGGTTSTTNRAVSPGCTGGQVKDANGKCVNERQFKKGGPIKKMQPGGTTRTLHFKGQPIEQLAPQEQLTVADSMKFLTNQGLYPTKQNYYKLKGQNKRSKPVNYKKGGPIKKMQYAGATGPNPNPTGKKPFEDILGAAAGIAGILGASSYFNSDKAAARQKARLEKRDERKEARQTARNLAKSKRREEKGFKAISGPSFKNGGATSFGMLSVKAGVDKNPKPTAADRIAGAKMKKKMGGSTKKK